MNAPVDVLAVLDSLIEFHDTTDSLKGRNCIAARAAMAELIQLSRVIDAEFRSDPMAVQCFDLGVLRRWQAALARVCGAS